MKVVILCGGEGTRMREETEFKPKPLVEVGGKPILWHIMKIYAHYGYNDFIVALGYKGNMIKEYFLNWRTFVNDFTLETKGHELKFHKNGHDDFKITFVDTGLKSLTGERVRRLKDYITDDEFMLTYGDGVGDVNIPELLEFHHRQNTIGTITGVNPAARYGMIEIDEPSGKIVNFKQNTISGVENYTYNDDIIINGGFMVFKKEFLNYLEPDTMVESAFPNLANRGQLSLYKHTGKWKAMDTYKEVEEMNEYWNEDPFWKVWENNTSTNIFSSFTQNSYNALNTNNNMDEVNSLFQTDPGSSTFMPQDNANKFFGKNILVTGGTGLVGGHLVESLIKAGANVFCTIRSKNPKSYFYQNKFDEKVVTINCDLTDSHRVFDVVSKYEIEYIFHLAAQPIVATAFTNPFETFHTNVMGTVNILEAARRSAKISGVVVASSDKAYGKNCVNATEDRPLAGDHPYDVSKSATDLIARTYHNTYGLPVAVSRFGNIYGPGDLNLNRIVPGIMKSLFKGETLEIRSDGKFVRDYVYVKDVVDGYLLLAENIEKTKGDAFNFSTGYNLSVLDLVNQVSNIIGKQVPFVVLNNQQNEIPFQSLSFQKAQSLLGWQSKYKFEEGIKETYKWYSGLFGN
jgi:CDP-glucose 4,6-dehydratase